MTAKIACVWEPRGWQIDLWKCPVAEILVEGPRGSGKSAGPLGHFASFCGLGFGRSWRGVIFRRTYPELEEIIAQSRAMYSLLGSNPTFNVAKSEWTWPQGEKLMFRHMRTPEDYWGYHGWSVPWVLWDELTTWPTLECYDLARSINRGVADPVICPQCKAKGCSMCGGTGRLELPRRYLSTTNPHGKGHNVVKARFIDPAPARTIIRTEETIHLPDREGVYQEVKMVSERVRLHAPFRGSVLAESDPDYLARLLTNQPEHIRKAWGAGDWDITSGGMFDDVWVRGRHAIESFEIPESWQIIRSFDWGSSAPFSYGLWAITTEEPAELDDGRLRHYPSGSLIRIREFYGAAKGRDNEGLRWTADRVGEKLRKLEEGWKLHKRVEKGPADNQIFDADAHGKTIAEAMESHGIKFRRSDKRAGSRVTGWERMRTMLEASAEDVPDRPGIWVFERECPAFLRFIPTAPRDEKKLDDIDTDSEDHVADETRYVVLDRRDNVTTQASAHVFSKKAW